MSKKPPKIAELPDKSYEVEQLIIRTQAFQTFRAIFPEIEDDDALIPPFEHTLEGDYVATKFDEYRGYEGPISHATRIRPDGRLSMEVDMARPKGEILEYFIHILDKYHKKRHNRGEGAPEYETIQNKFRAYDLVEKHNGNVLHATWEMYPETNGLQPSYDPDTDRKYKRIRRWYLEVQVKIGDL